jgi:hypothetical protein
VKRFIPIIFLAYPIYNLVLWLVIYNSYEFSAQEEKLAIFSDYTLFNSYFGMLNIILSASALIVLLVFQDNWYKGKKIAWTALAVLSVVCLSVHGWSML